MITDWADLVYLPHGRVAHVKAFTEQAAYPSSLCGRTPQLFGTWLGTGTQAERDRANALPRCGACAAFAERRTA